MSLLPGIGAGGLVASRTEADTVQTSVPEVTKRGRNGHKSLLEISQNFQSVRYDDDNKLRSRSFEPWSADENEIQKRKKAKTDRSKSLGNIDKQRETKRKKPDDRTGQYTDKNNGPKSKSPKKSKSERQVRFDSSSEESFSKNDHDRKLDFKSSTPKPFGVQYKIGESKNGVSMETSPISSGQGSPVEPKKLATQGSHQTRLKATRAKARNWAETASDPGPNEKSIENDKVIRGQQIDPRRARTQTDNARSKHAQYMSQDRQQDGRPKAADKEKRLQSLPAKKEQHASETEDRAVISAPSKNQGQMDAPMPKINTLLPKDNKTNKTTEPQPGASKDFDPSVSPRKQKEHNENKQKRESVEQSVSPQKREPKEPSVSQQKREQIEPSVSPQKRELKVQSVSPQKRETKEHSISPQKREQDPKQMEHEKKIDNEKNRHAPHAAARASGLVDSTDGKEERKSNKSRNLPADDHGPVNPSPKPVQVVKPSQENTSDKNFKYYASEKERQAANDRNKATEESPRVPSEKSTKTDKTWTTVKSKNTDSKQSNYSYPAGPTKSQTTYELSSVDNSERKRREVTIVDPKYLRRADKLNDEDEPFMHEYEYSHAHIRHKNFKDMDDEEKIEYFRDELHMKPDQIRELTFHPKVTEPKVIHHAYTGVETVNWSSARVKSGRRPKSRKFSVYKKVSVVPPNQRKSAMLSKLQGVVYRKINKVYGASPRDTREKQFFEKLAQIQIDDMQRRYEMLAEKERKQLESKFRQRDQLRRLRRKFEDDAWRRFMTQYVTSKVVEAEYRNRAEYGLPNDLQDRPRKHPQTIRSVNPRRADFAMTPKRIHRKNEKKYANLFRFNTGPIPKSGGKPLKFEGFDTVYLDTEDEHGKPTKKKQNVDALMREARRILNQTDDEETDLEDTPRKTQSEKRRAEKRPYHRPRDRKSIPDDKSYKSTQTQSTRKSYNRPPPKTMKEIINRRKAVEAPANRYKASNFASMKADLVKDSDQLNKNEKLQKIQTEFPQVETSSKSDSVQSDVSKPKHFRERSPEYIPASSTHKTPAQSPVPTRTHTPVKTKTVTQTQVTTITTVKTETTTDKPDEKTEWKVKDGNVYLDNMETQMAIETARDKIEEDRKPTRGPSRASNTIEEKSKSNGSRAPSRVSFRGKQEQPIPRDLRPPRAPSRVSVLTTDSKNADVTTNKSHRRHSRASVIPLNAVQSPAKNNEHNSNEKVSKEVDRKIENHVTETETVKLSDGQSLNDLERGHPKDENIPPKAERGSQVNVKQVSRHSSISSTQPQKTVSGRTSVVGIATTNGRISPTVEKQGQVPHRRESYIDKLRQNVQRKESITEKSSVRTEEPQIKHIDTRQMNGHISPQSRQTESDKSFPKSIVTKSVNVTENVAETTNSDIIRTRQPVKRQVSNEPQRGIDHRDNDLLSTRKVSYHDRNSDKIENNERPRPKGKPTQKKDTSKSKKAPPRRRSRSRTPQRDQSKMNGHDDVKMDRNEYEKMGHDGSRPSRRSESIEGSQRGRRRSTSRGRKTSVSKGRKRSVSSERKKGKKGSVTKSRFPDIKKKEGKWEVKARSPVQKVSKTESVDEYTTERLITPKPQGANQWKDLVEKYLRQPSPKVGKTEDRSLLDSNIDDDDDDDEMDIFTRAQMKYKLNLDQSTEEEDSDDE